MNEKSLPLFTEVGIVIAYQYRLFFFPLLFCLSLKCVVVDTAA